MPDVTAERFIEQDDGDYTDVDALIAVEVYDPAEERGINLHVDPRTDDTVTCSLSAREAWMLARELAKAASEVERES